MSLFAQKSRPEMVATIYGSSQAQLSERLGVYMRCDARLLRTQKSPASRGSLNGLCDLQKNLFQALSPDVLLQVVNLRGYPVDSTSETVIIEFSICCKSWAFSIAHAAGSGR